MKSFKLVIVFLVLSVVLPSVVLATDIESVELDLKSVSAEMMLEDDSYVPGEILVAI